jgi:hypothetical protein
MLHYVVTTFAARSMNDVSALRLPQCRKSVGSVVSVFECLHYLSMSRHALTAFTRPAVVSIDRKAVDISANPAFP